MSSLEQRVRELEAMVVGQATAGNNTAVVIPVTPSQQTKLTRNESEKWYSEAKIKLNSASPMAINKVSGKQLDPKHRWSLPPTGIDKEAERWCAEVNRRLSGSALMDGHGRSSHVPPPTQLIISNSSPSSSVTQQLMAKEVVSKEVEIERLQAKLRKAYAQMERQQADYDEEVRKFKKDSEQAKEELVRVVNKLNDLEAQSVKYQEKAKTLDSGQLNAIAETQERVRAQEKELARLRNELAEKEKIAKHYEEMKKELNYLELQNETLSQTLDSKESTVKELERHLASMRMEATLYQQSCSSGSTPLADETESLAEIRPPFTPSRPYTKAHSTLGANLSPTPRPKNSGGLTKSLSNYAIDANCNRRDDVSAAMSRSLRSTQRKLVDSRLLVKCLKETVERLARGENPDISRLLGIKTDSMSESEAEQVAFDSTAMTMGVAEKMMRRQEESMVKLEQDLDAIRYLIQDFYQAKVGDTLNGRDDACRIQ